MAYLASELRQPAPLADMNTTPLIDVLLVLLVMMILTIPIATNSLDVDLPGPPTKTAKHPNPVMNRITITSDDRILWNGEPIDHGQLVASLHAAARLSPQPELQFDPDGDASYDTSAQVMNTIKRSGTQNFGFVGNHRFREFKGNAAAGAR